MLPPPPCWPLSPDPPSPRSRRSLDAEQPDAITTAAPTTSTTALTQLRKVAMAGGSQIPGLSPRIAADVAAALPLRLLVWAHRGHRLAGAQGRTRGPLFDRCRARARHRRRIRAQDARLARGRRVGR